jgi:hypothetical protein
MPPVNYEKGGRGQDHRTKGNTKDKGPHKTIIREIIEPVYFDNSVKNFVRKVNYLITVYE